MSFAKLFFLTVFLVCYVHSYRPESERTVPSYEPAMDEIQDSNEPMGTVSADRSDRANTGANKESEEPSQPEEGFKQKVNKKEKRFGHTSDSNGHKFSKKYANNEGVSENTDSKEFKNKKSNGKTYNKKHNRHNSEPNPKAKYEGSETDFAADEQPSHDSIHKEFNPTSKVTKSESVASERVERSAKFESEPLAETEQREVKYQNKEKNRKSDYKSGKNGKYSKKNSKNSSKRQKRNNGYFGFWA